MNAFYLVLAAALVFVLGYRFYSRLLALGVFRLDEIPEVVDPEITADKRQRYKRHLIFGQHLASLAAAAAITGTMVSLIWGWVPAFLWVVVGTVTAAGTYGIGALWLSLRYPGLNPAEIATRLIGARAHVLFALIALALLLILTATSLVLAAHILSSFPGVVLPFWTLVLLAMLMGMFIRGREDGDFIVASIVTHLLVLLAVWLLGDVTLAVTGALNLELKTAYLTIDANILWMLALLLYGYHATRQPMWKLIRPRGFLTTLLLGTMLALCLVGVVIGQPALVTPDFNPDPEKPLTLPWLFVTLSSGAVAGVHWLIANGITARQMKRETDARYLGYGGALGLGLLALSAIIIGGTGFAGMAEWSQQYASWEGIRDLRRALDLYINGFAKLTGNIGFDPALARTLAAVVLLGLLVATLEAGLRVQKHLLTGLTELRPGWLPANERPQISIVVLLSGGLALIQSSYLAHQGGWPLFGVADLMLAVLGLALIMLALRQAGRPVAWVAAPLIFLAVVAHWALAMQIGRWWSQQDWLWLGIGMALLAIELALAWFIGQTWNAVAVETKHH